MRSFVRNKDEGCQNFISGRHIERQGGANASETIANAERRRRRKCRVSRGTEGKRENPVGAPFCWEGKGWKIGFEETRSFYSVTWCTYRPPRRG
ncbi:hypothetical protein R1flu_007699 [Riccia fluitans]|uniref:Uncharacterized protein n=1 Tax=Riccia fluitans TaxID=41844 RepID=A0ABD1Z0G9_9MARC